MQSDKAVHSERVIDAMVRELNLALWAMEPRADGTEIKPLLEELFRFARQYNMSQMARDCGINRNTLWRIFRRSKNMRFTTLVRLCYYMGLRFRIEIDPVPRRLAYGSNHPDYVPTVDKQGNWPLDEEGDDEEGDDEEEDDDDMDDEDDADDADMGVTEPDCAPDREEAGVTEPDRG